MNTINPETGQGKAKFLNADNLKQRLGFANRNLTAVESGGRPNALKNLGDSQVNEFQQSQFTIPSAVRNKVGAWAAYNPAGGQFATPSVTGVCTLELQHIFSYEDPYRENRYTQIFDTWWSRVRTWYTGGQDVTGVDLQLWLSGIMDVIAQLTNIRRIIRAIHSQFTSGCNRYIQREAMPTWFGFRPANIKEINTHDVNDWINRYNEMIGDLNAIWAPQDLIPGFRRWASFYECAYKDEDVTSDYCQMYTFYPAKMYKLEEREIPASRLLNLPEDKKINYSELNNIQKSTLQQHTKRGMTVKSTNDTVIAWELVGYNDMYNRAYTTFTAQFERYFTLVQEAITAVTKNSSSLQVLSIIQSVLSNAGKMPGSQPSDLCNLAQFELPIIDNDPEPIEYVYDTSLLLAIHNATIMTGLQVHSFSQIMPEMIGFQQINATADTPSALLANCPKPLDLPDVTTSNNELISATQWTVTNQPAYDPTTAVIGAPDGFAYGAMKTDVITAGYFLIYDESHPDLDAQTTFSIYRCPLLQCVPHTLATDTDAYALWASWCNTYCDVSGTIINPTQYLAMVEDMHYIPMHYIFEKRSQNRVTFTDILNQDGVLFVADWGAQHAQNQTFVQNFWGFPFNNVAKTADFTLAGGNPGMRSIR